MRDLSIGRRLLAGFAILFILFLVFSGNIFFNISENESTVNASQQRLRKVIVANYLIYQVNFQMQTVAVLMSLDSKDEQENIFKSRAKVKEYLEEMQKLSTEENEKQFLKNILEVRSRYLSATDGYFKLLSEKDDKASARSYFFKTMRPLLTEYLGKVDELIVYESDRSVSETETLLKRMQNSERRMRNVGVLEKKNHSSHSVNTHSRHPSQVISLGNEI